MLCTAIYKFPCFSLISYDIMGFTWLPKGLEVLVRSVSLKWFAEEKNQILILDKGTFFL